jgi:1-phosphatidylinositol-3-phosphate 5-kinase
LSSLDLLSRMREAFQKTEHDLYAELARTAAATLNDVRRSFYTAARGAKRRLGAWEDKHVPHKRGEAPTVDVLAAPEPAWFDRAYHAVPGGHVIVRDGDWGSIIAFTLSCTDYVRELASLTVSRASLAPSDVPSAATSPLPSPTPPSGLSKRSYFTAPFTRAANPKPDPDQDDVSWHEPETCSAVISRKQHPRDPRDPAQLFARVLEGGGSLPSQLLGGRARAGGAAPAAAYAKPAVELSTHAAGGEVDTQHTESAGQLLQELEAANADAVPSAFAPSVPSSSDFVETHIRRGKGPSLVSSSGSSVSGAESVGGGSTLSDHTIPAQPPSSWRMPGQSTDGSRSATPSESGEAHERADTHALSLTNTLANAVKFMLKAGGDTLRPPSAAAAAAAAKNHHALLSTDPLVIDERPHIKYDFTVGKMRFSCTAYYAKQFDVLRRRCGVEDVFLRSMQTSANWAADGGKSKSNFWKTADDRYIIKTLVNAWNVADLYARPFRSQCPR